MLRWAADSELVSLLRRYYSGEAGLWGAIQERIERELRARELSAAPRHIRFQRTATGYDVRIEIADGYEQA